ncbi:hypothetical protein MCEZLEM10_01457 [Methylophilaceae bacterium]
MKFKCCCHAGKRVARPVNFSAAQCDALFSAVLVHDQLYPDAVLPDTIHLDYTSEQLNECFQICQQLWQAGPKRQYLKQMIEKIYSLGELDAEDQYAYYCMRAKIKHLRFAFVMFDEKHKYPMIFHWMTAVMGHLQDVLKNAQHSSVKFAALLVKLFLSKPFYAMAANEIEKFQPSSVESFRQYVLDEMHYIRMNLAKGPVTSHEFHEMRKVISRQVAMYDNFKTLYPSAYHQSISQCVSTLNGLMGSLHDELIAKKFDKTQHYYKDKFVIPDEIRLRLEQLENKYLY